jgi:hypothetical protein
MSRKTIGLVAAALVVGVMAGTWVMEKTNRCASGPIPSLVSADNGSDVAGQVSFLSGFAPLAKRVPRALWLSVTFIIRVTRMGSLQPRGK